MSFLTAPLSRNGPHVPRIRLGLIGLSIFYRATKPDSQRLALLDKAHNLGQRFWDTADMYSNNKDLLRKWFAANPNKRSDIFLATKFANKTLPDRSSAVDSTPKYARTACKKSLQRLGLPSVNLYYVHQVNLKTLIEKTMEALVELKNEGKFKYIGLSEVSSSTLRRAHAVHLITAVQIEYSPFALEAENENGTYLLATARKLGVAVVCYSPLGRGLFGGALRSPDNFEQSDFRKHLPRFSQESFSKNIKLVDQLTKVANKKGVTLGQLTLAWLLAQGEDIFPIPGTTSQERLAENGHSVTINLTEDKTAKVRKLVNAADVSRSRYPEAFMSLCYADTPIL